MSLYSELVVLWSCLQITWFAYISHLKTLQPQDTALTEPMTIQFVPGDPNKSQYGLDQAQWKNHHILAYGSGNNLIIYSSTDHRDPSVQTVYLEKDPIAVCINSTNGLICVSCGAEILVLKPLNEFMHVPKWTETLRMENDKTTVNCMKWGVSENELVVGSQKGLILHHLYVEYGEVKSNVRWEMPQASPVEGLDVTDDASKIVTYNFSNFDCFAKVWMRMNYGDVNSLFDLVYSNHRGDKWLTHFQWRKGAAPLSADSNGDLYAMANIKNIRSYIPSSESRNDILFTFTNDHLLNVWATYDFSGHSHLKLWSEFDMTADLELEYMSALIVENFYLQSTLVPELADASEDSELASYFSQKDMNDLDLLIVLGKSGEAIVYAVLNVSANPPNAIKFDKVCATNFDKICLPNYAGANGEETDVTLMQFQLEANPITVGNILATEGRPALSYLVHDRIKDTIRFNEVSFKGLMEDWTAFPVTLRNKFQGHAKSIQKLVTSTSSYEGNIMMSILSFPEHNYIWEPLLLLPEQQKCMSITKRFRLNVTRNSEEDFHNQGIMDAILINDIAEARGQLRHHLAIVVERGGYLSIWDCNGVTMDDKDAEMITRVEIVDSNGDKIFREPQALFLTEIAPKEYAVLCVYDAVLLQAWKVSIDQETLEVRCKTLKVKQLPGEYSGFCTISAVDTFLEKDLSVIDDKGVFRSFAAQYNQEKDEMDWLQTSFIYTNILKASKIHGASLIKKIAIVDESGLKFTIWDTKSGLLEFEQQFPEEYGKVRDLDWTFIDSYGASTNAILSVGFSRFVLLYTQLRYDYTNRVPTFAVLKKIDISDYTSHEIGDLIWIDDCYLVIGSGNQFFIDDKWVLLGEKPGGSTNSSIDTTIRQLMIGYNVKQSSFLISDLVRILNGPLPVYHPQFLIQALLMNEVKLVEEILVKLLQTLRLDSQITWNLDFELLNAVFHEKKKNTRRRRLSSFGAAGMEDGSIEVFEAFNPAVLELLVEKLTKISLPLLTRHQQVTLTNVVNIVNDLSQFKGSLDENGLKFLTGFKLLKSSLKQSKLTMRDISWALHSDQKEMVFSFVDNFYNHRLTWDSVKQVGLVYWLDQLRLTTLIETIARNEFGDTRDPSGRVSVLYLAIKKKQVLVGLWRTVSHQEKQKLLKFLGNNFNEERWRSAALKNAFVLLGKHRYMDAAYFFLLAGQVKDCCITLCNKLDDIELALAVAKVNSDKESVMRIIESFILPKALLNGDRWMTSWVFWEMKLKEISIQALVKSPIDVVKHNVEHFSESFQKDMQKVVLEAKSRSFLRDDPVLAVLFHKLRESKLNYLQGSLAILPEEEFNFVVKVSTIYTRMGCDYLALLLVRNWEFPVYELRKDTKKPFKEKDIFLEFSAPTQNKIAPAPTAFEEPDMSSFSFGF